MTSTPLVGDSFFGIDLRQLTARLQGMRRHVSKRVLLLEFASEGLRVAEARFSGAGLQYDHLTVFPLPEEALERGVPADPIKMGRLIQQICREKQISVHRAAVVLPSEVAFRHLIDLPVGLSAEDARAYVLKPSNGLQIPIALGQADFDLLPTQLPVVQNASASTLQSYLITAIPGNLVDRVTETLQVADLELQALEVGSHSQLRLMISDLMLLGAQQLRLVLELQSECTHFSLVGEGGAFRFERLAAIRDFPDPDLTDEQANSVLQEGGVAETIGIRQESYLAISELDLRVLTSEVRDALRRFSCDWSGFELVDIVLTGRNSAHPRLPALLSDAFGCPARALEPLLVHGLEGMQFESLVVQKSLNRLIGLGLGLLPTEHLLACPLTDVDRSLVLQRGIPLVDISPPVKSQSVPNQLLINAEVPDQHPDRAQAFQVESSADSIQKTAEQSLVIPEIFASIDVPEGTVDEIEIEVLSTLDDHEFLKGTSMDAFQGSDADALLPLVQDANDDSHPDQIVHQAEPVDSTSEQWPSIASAPDVVVEGVQTPMSRQSDQGEDQDQAQWPSVVDAGVSAPESEEIKDSDAVESASPDDGNIREMQSEMASTSSLSLKLEPEQASIADLDQPDDQWPSIADSDASLSGCDEGRSIEVSGKAVSDQAGMKTQSTPAVAEQDVELLLGELRFSDEE